MGNLVHYNASAFGAVGDGTTDDGPAIQNAMNALSAAGGGVLLLDRPGGVYGIGAPVATFTGTVSAGSPSTISGVSSFTGLAVGQPISSLLGPSGYSAYITGLNPGAGTVGVSRSLVAGSGRFEAGGQFLIPMSNVTVRGLGKGATTLQALSSTAVFANHNTARGGVAISNFYVEQLTVTGSLNTPSNTTSPTTTRTLSKAACTAGGVYLFGSLTNPAVTNGVTGQTGPWPPITNVGMRSVTVQRCTGMPADFAGCTNVVLEDCDSYLTKDWGWLYCTGVRIIGCRSYWSSDNGFSVSRGNVGVVMNNCHAEMTGGDTAYHLSGFDGYAGPRDVSISTVTARNVANFGISISQGASAVVITGFVLDMGYNRGGADALSDYNCTAIQIQGDLGNPGNPSSYSTGIHISDGVIIGAPRAGIQIEDCQNSTIADVEMYDVGTSNLAGTTGNNGSSTAGYTTQCVGIMSMYPTTNTNVKVRSVRVIDRRDTPYCNWAIALQTAPVTTSPPPASPYIDFDDIEMLGCRNGPSTSPRGVPLSYVQPSTTQSPSGRSLWYPNYALSPVEGGSAAPTGQIYAYALPVPSTMLFTAIGVYISTAGDSTAEGRAGIYADNGLGFPGALILDAGSKSLHTTSGGAGAAGALNWTGLSQTLTPGLYWLAFVVSSAVTAPKVVQDQSTRGNPVFGQSGNTGAAQSQSTGWLTTSTSNRGALPVVFPAAVPTALGTLILACG